MKAERDPKAQRWGLKKSSPGLYLKGVDFTNTLWLPF
jgi:hypothetical protein